MRQFTPEEIAALSAFETNYRTAIDADWTRHPGRDNLALIHEIFCRATGDQRRLNDNCQHCILALIKDCGTKYYADKAKAVAVSPAPVKATRAKVTSTKSKK